MKKTIHQSIRSFNPRMHENDSFNLPGIRLGIALRESPERLASYFEAHGDFTSDSFMVTEYVWAQLHQTPKNSFYTVEKRFFIA
ncbi:MAG: hypothetical protein HWD61_12245 [Parachlamydiaceae bacterium]|nr:MAG: hypothetical protein HWD61_12245 [Parachlamydiaceae bacterium]